MKIIIETIPHRLQRYNTIGDWQTDKTTGNVRVYVSQLDSWRYELLIAIHEIVEAFACLHDGILEENVDKFDKAYTGENEPGDEPTAPYVKQHCLATGIERILAFALGVNWLEYEARLDEVSKELRDVRPSPNTSV